MRTVSKLTLALTAALASLVPVALATTSSAATPVSASRPYDPQCNNITTNTGNVYPNGSPLGGNPRTGMAHNEYYYLDFTACSTSATFKVDTQWCWDIQIFVGPNHNFPRMVKFDTDVTNPLIDYTFATKVGQEYAIRVQNLMSLKTDVSQVTS